MPPISRPITPASGPVMRKVRVILEPAPSGSTRWSPTLVTPPDLVSQVKRRSGSSAVTRQRRPALPVDEQPIHLCGRRPRRRGYPVFHANQCTMWYMTAPAPKERLLDAVVESALTDGIADKSLRAIAAGAGTSHRMLIHHFGSKECLLVEVIRAVEARQRALFAEWQVDQNGPLEELGRAFWSHLRDPVLAPQERLFFEIYGQALQGREWAKPLLPGVVDDWIGPPWALLTALREHPGTPQ